MKADKQMWRQRGRGEIIVDRSGLRRDRRGQNDRQTGLRGQTAPRGRRVCKVRAAGGAAPESSRGSDIRDHGTRRHTTPGWFHTVPNERPDGGH